MLTDRFKNSYKENNQLKEAIQILLHSLNFSWKPGPTTFFGILVLRGEIVPMRLWGSLMDNEFSLNDAHGDFLDLFVRPEENLILYRYKNKKGHLVPDNDDGFRHFIAAALSWADHG